MFLLYKILVSLVYQHKRNNFDLINSLLHYDQTYDLQLLRPHIDLMMSYNLLSLKIRWKQYLLHLLLGKGMYLVMHSKIRDCRGVLMLHLDQLGKVLLSLWNLYKERQEFHF